MSTLSAAYSRNLLTRIETSRRMPRRSNSDLGTRHRGQGHKPLFRIVARRTLFKNIQDGPTSMRIQGGLLFRIISRVGKKPGVDASLNPVNALDDNSIGIVMNEEVVKNFCPDGMHKFTTAVRHNVGFLCSPFTMKCRCKVLKRVGQLKNKCQRSCNN